MQVSLSGTNTTTKTEQKGGRRSSCPGKVENSRSSVPCGFTAWLLNVTPGAIFQWPERILRISSIGELVGPEERQNEAWQMKTAKFSQMPRAFSRKSGNHLKRKITLEYRCAPLCKFHRWATHISVNHFKSIYRNIYII